MKHNTNFFSAIAFKIILIVAGLLFLSPLCFAEGPDKVFENEDITFKPSHKSPWSVHLFYGLGVFGTGDDSVLSTKGESTIFALDGFKSTRALGLDVDYIISDWFVLRAGYQQANLDFGADLYDFNDTSFQSKSVQIFTARHEMYKFSAIFDTEDIVARSWKPFEISYGAGLMIGYSRCSNIKLSQDGVKVMGIEQVSTQGGLSGGLEAEARMRLGRSNWSLGLSGTLMFNAGGTKLNFKTSEDSIFKSTSSSFLGNTMGMTLSYRF
jgi:hypothetical protein